MTGRAHCQRQVAFFFRYGSDHVKRNFLAPSIAGDVVACLGVSEPGAGSDVASMYMYFHG